MEKKFWGYKTAKQRNLFLICWLIYFSTYICRLNYSAVMPELTADNVLAPDKLASVSSAFFICYGTSQFISGILCDRLNPRLMIFGGVSISAISNILLFFFHSYPMILILWAINGIAQAFVWAPLLKIVSMHYEGKEKDKFGIDISTTVPIGTLGSYAVSLITLAFLPWKYVFLMCGSIELLFAFMWIISTRNLTHTAVVAEATSIAVIPPIKASDTIRLMFIGGVFLMLIPIAIQGTLKDSVTQWVPTFFSNKFGSSTTFSLALTMILPIINVTGAYFAKAVNKRLHNELKTVSIFFSISLLFLIALSIFGTKSIPLALISMAGVTNCMFACNVMLITMVPLHFQKSGRVGTISGFLNATAYIGCGLLNMPAGKILESTSNWNMLFILWMGLAILAIVITLICIPMWKKFVQNEKN